MEFYSGDELLNTKDVNGNDPSVYVATSNRTAGKTTYFESLFINKFCETGSQTVHFFRSKAEVEATWLIVKGVCDMEENELITEPHEITQGKSIADGMVHTYLIDGQLAGYGIYLGHYVKLKKFSPLFSKVDYTFLDEYQPEDGKFMRNEVTAYISLIYSIGRGNGEMIRPVRNIMAGNLITLMNPYLIKSGLYKIINATSDTSFFRTKGWVAEFNYNEDAAKAVKESAFGQAFENDRYIANNTENIYLFDATKFIENIKSKSQRYLFTVKYNSILYGFRIDNKTKIVYVSDKADPSYPTVIVFRESEHDEKTIHADFCKDLMRNIIHDYHKGKLRFNSLETKDAAFEFMALSIYQ
ncbi:phage DNA encapsidation protein [Bacteroides acidifaciens]|uniref:phage DNA encapsidation protein n=1 Tax=Bacteroides acidifaciens TaxID=85831 RepID=UPI0025ADBFE3|nr:phage DNA encapsidation protein [Bacteroides acidifaciens]